MTMFWVYAEIPVTRRRMCSECGDDDNDNENARRGIIHIHNVTMVIIIDRSEDYSMDFGGGA